ncbi:MAG: response regulator [Deltaproteobacteria bacterium]|nr:response regulator [Deltaproteobacteria bacterium]
MAKQHILIVDDDSKSLRVLEISLKKSGFSVTTASNGIDALEKVAVSVPELIISDVKMPKMNGYQFCQRIKDDPKLATIPFIFLTSQRSVEDKVRGLELGVDDYLTKPIYIRELIARVRLLLQKKEKETLERVDQQNMFQGALSDLGVVDLLQTIEIGRKTGLILLTSGDKSGVMYVQNGRVIDSICGNLRGARAVYRLLTWNDGAFKIDFKPVYRQETIELSTQALIMEGMRRLDEFERLAEQLPPLDSVLVIDPQELLQQYPEGFPSKAGEIIQLFNGKRTILEVADECGLDDLPALNIMSKFYFQGLLKELRTESANVVVQPNGAITMPGPNPAATMSKVVPDEPSAGEAGIVNAGQGVEIDIDDAELVRPPDAPAESSAIPKQAESPLSESRMREMLDEVAQTESGGDDEIEFNAPETPQQRRHLRAVPSAAVAEKHDEETDPTMAAGKRPANMVPPAPVSRPPARPSVPPAATPPAPPASLPPQPEKSQPPAVVSQVSAPTPPVRQPATARLDEVEAEEVDDNLPVGQIGESGSRPVIIAVVASVAVTLLVVFGAGTFIFSSYLKPLLDRMAGQAGVASPSAVAAYDLESLDRLIAAYAPAELRSAIQQIDRTGSGGEPELLIRHAVATARLGFLLEDMRLVTQAGLEFDRLPAAMREAAAGKLVQAEIEVYRDRNELARQLAAAVQEMTPPLGPIETAQAETVRALAIMKLGQPEVASQMLSPLATRFPDLIMPRYVLAWILTGAGNAADATVWSGDLVRKNPNHSAGHLLAARNFRRSRDTGNALEALARAEVADPSDPRPGLERADLRVKETGELTLAASEVDSLLARDSVRSNSNFHAWALALKALILAERGSKAEARVVYEQARALDRTRPELDRIQKALAEPAAAPAVAGVSAATPRPRPERAEPDYAAEGRAALRRGQHKRASDLLAKAVETKPDDGQLWFDLGIASIESDNTGRALNAFANAALHDPNRAETHFYLGQLYSSTRKNNMAVQSYERFLKLAPDHPKAPLARAILPKLKAK